jgi:16S rRNA (uracil1498-N3)-methyltransferase
MDYKRFIIKQNCRVGDCVTVEGVQYNHMINVTRQRKGDCVILLNGDGYDYTAQIKEIDKRSATLVVLDKEKNNRFTRLALKVFCGLLKGDGSEFQAEKLSELGAVEFTPFISENCVVKSDSKKAERIMRIAEESSKQCKRAVPLKVSQIVSFKEALDIAKSCEIKLIAYEFEANNTLKQALSGVEDCTSAALFIGPEGGFTEEEIKEAASFGFAAITLGKTILKADTAAIAAASAILYEAGEWSR